MKNKLYASLLMIAVSNCVQITAVGANGAGETPLNLKGPQWGSTVATAPRKGISNYGPHAIYEKPNLRHPTTVLGGNPSTYAPSEDENFLIYTAKQLNDLADKLAQLRIHDRQVFMKYFEKSLLKQTREKFSKMNSDKIPDLSIKDE